jgi:hypothetical protein
MSIYVIVRTKYAPSSLPLLQQVLAVSSGYLLAIGAFERIVFRILVFACGFTGAYVNLAWYKETLRNNVHEKLHCNNFVYTHSIKW